MKIYNFLLCVKKVSSEIINGIFLSAYCAFLKRNRNNKKEEKNDTKELYKFAKEICHFGISFKFVFSWQLKH